MAKITIDKKATHHLKGEYVSLIYYSNEKTATLLVRNHGVVSRMNLDKEEFQELRDIMSEVTHINIEDNLQSIRRNLEGMGVDANLPKL
jgi:hypothetical protein